MEVQPILGCVKCCQSIESGQVQLITREREREYASVLVCVLDKRVRQQRANSLYQPPAISLKRLGTTACGAACSKAICACELNSAMRWFVMLRRLSHSSVSSTLKHQKQQQKSKLVQGSENEAALSAHKHTHARKNTHTHTA